MKYIIARKDKLTKGVELSEHEEVNEKIFYDRVFQSLSKFHPDEKELPVKPKTEELFKDVKHYLKARMPITINQTDHFYITR